MRIQTFLAAFTLVAATSGNLQPLLAQGGSGPTAPPILGGAPFIEAWVDPLNGNDALAAVGAPDRPFSTLFTAIQSVSFAGASAANPGIVHANPGIYSLATNGETLPVIMTEFVNVQGTDARSCVIRGDGFSDGFAPFLPFVGGGAGVPGEILVDFTFLSDPSYTEMIDAFTFQGGDVQVYAETEIGDIDGRVSNCLFDMLDSSDVGVSGPSFGILMVHVWDLTGGGVYPDIRMHVLNNTFVDTWIPTADPASVVQSIPSSVGICDVNNPLARSGDGDPDPTLRGVGNPNIQNNLIRTSTTNGAGPRTALLGIDVLDVAAFVGAGAALTNAFDPGATGGVDFSGTYTSAILGGAPVQVRNPNAGTGGVDPGFVGEYLSALPASGGFGLPTAYTRDWRLLPASPMVGLGSAPTGGVLAAINGTAHVVPLFIPEMSYDFDGEGYGNLRLQGGLDLGFDQADILTLCGGYANDTRDLNASPFPGAPTLPGLGFKLYILPGAGVLWSGETRTTASPITGYTGPFQSAFGFFWAYSAQFGLSVPPTILPNLPPGTPVTNSLLWLNATPPGPITFSVPLAGLPVPGPLPYTPPAGGGAAHPGGVSSLLVPGLGAPQGLGEYLNEQVAFNPAGTPALLLSNVQCSRD